MRRRRRLCANGSGALLSLAAEAKDPGYHSYMSHSHYSYDRDSGRAKFTQDVNRMFERNGMAFELKDGEVVRLAPAVLHEALAESAFRTGDSALDEMLESSRQKILHRSIDVRRESLETFWDAWERLKTLEPGRDKRESAGRLLDKAATDPTLRAKLEEEQRARHLATLRDVSPSGAPSLVVVDRHGDIIRAEAVLQVITKTV